MKLYNFIGLLLGVSSLSYALTWQDLWSRADQQGQQLFYADKPASAANRFKNLHWRAAALYKSAKYIQAAQLYAKFKTKDDYYNQGNAWAQAHHFQHAINAYNQALTIDPTMRDARHNLALLKKLLRDQPKQHNAQQQSSQHNSTQFQSKTTKNTPQQQVAHQKKQEKYTNKHSQQVSTPKKQFPVSTDSAHTHKIQKNIEQQQASTQNKASQTNTPQGPQQDKLSFHATHKMLQQLRDTKWLEKVPDDPGGLLRRKFLRDYQKEQSNHE